MKITCADRERIFLDGTEEEWATLDAHAATCAECGKEVREWKALTLAAEELRDYEESSALWQRIERSLRAEAEKETPRQTLWERLAIWRNVPLGWQAAFMGALVLALSISGWYLRTHRAPKDAGAAGRLLKSDALQKVEEAERTYVQAIDTLATDAKPQLDDAASPLMASYREKLMVIDSAIDELRAQAGQNPSNAHLRNQLLAMYQEKKETLEEVLETKR